jgi:hypothetical protein
MRRARRWSDTGRARPKETCSGPLVMSNFLRQVRKRVQMGPMRLADQIQTNRTRLSKTYKSFRRAFDFLLYIVSSEQLIRSTPLIPYFRFWI